MLLDEKESGSRGKEKEGETYLFVSIEREV